jgi:hypothetical protein
MPKFLGISFPKFLGKVWVRTDVFSGTSGTNHRSLLTGRARLTAWLRSATFIVMGVMRAMELIPAIRARLEQLNQVASGALVSGQRAAFWRAQQHAARLDSTVADLRRYCLESLRSRKLDEEDENDYLRGFRQGFQAVLEDIRRAEMRGR